MATLPLTALPFHLFRPSSEKLGWERIFGRCLQSFYLSCAIAECQLEQRKKTSPPKIIIAPCRGFFMAFCVPSPLNFTGAASSLLSDSSCWRETIHQVFCFSPALNMIVPD